MLLVCLAAGAALAVVPAVDGRSFGGVLATGSSARPAAAATTVTPRWRAPTGLATRGSSATTRPGSSTSPASASFRWTTALPRAARARRARRPRPRRPPLGRRRAGHGVHARGPARRPTYLQYWFYYPDSNTTWAGSDARLERNPCCASAAADPRYPGLPGLPQGRLGGLPGADRRARARVGPGPPRTATTRAARSAGATTAGFRHGLDPRLTRQPRGAHPGGSGRAREPAPGAPRPVPAALRLVPLERPRDRARLPGDYRPRSGVTPPWGKEVYREPESDRS